MIEVKVYINTIAYKILQHDLRKDGCYVTLAVVEPMPVECDLNSRCEMKTFIARIQHNSKRGYIAEFMSPEIKLIDGEFCYCKETKEPWNQSKR